MEKFAERLRDVMARRGLVDQQVADMVMEQTGVRMTRAYITQLRTGTQRNPTIGRLRALAQVLQVRASYLLGEPDPADEAPFAGLSIESREAMRVVLDLARRADRMPSAGRNTAPRPAVADDTTLHVYHPFTAQEVAQALAPAHPLPNRVGGRLRELRKAASLSTAEADLVVGGEPGLVESIEAGSTPPSPAMLSALLTRYGVVDVYQQKLFTSAAAGLLDDRWWYRFFGRLPVWLLAYLEMEDSAELIRLYDNATVPALLQHPDYALAVRQAAHFPQVAADQFDLALEIVGERQRRFLENDAVIWAVLQESVLLDNLGGIDVQLRQIDHLMELAARPDSRVRIQINRSGPDRYRPRGGTFSLMRLPGKGNPDVVWLPSLREDTMLADAASVMAYSTAHGRLAVSATQPDDAIKELARIRTVCEANHSGDPGLG
ncbi:helix-turn-helix domain-containing protein [Nonomuraea wenchangensis]|uniref:Helix-turn-helix domain-containing protein n=1 Tax=Nonomuraea wenchangensis TaxID=568860 RepID=A0A1I0LTV4_9ACTN|nr:helix-turn-helix transcriptional regulator [Nonomuraea wenchangensis]SEU46371.1 Helix-turn-helix domain-containing protein [Nonomuraea wenchangensis]